MEKYITGINKEKKYLYGENSEKNLSKILEIFFDNSTIHEQYKLYYEPQYGNRKREFFKIDSLVEFDGKKLAFEYDGFHHYNTVFKIERDIRKAEQLKSSRYSLIRVPYFIQFTKDVAKTYFEPYNVYSDDKYTAMLEQVYKVDDESQILAPGWHKTTETPANWVDKGIELFLEDIKFLPESVTHQLIHSLNVYKKATNGKEWLVHPNHHAKFNAFLSSPVDKKYLNYFFAHEV